MNLTSIRLIGRYDDFDCAVAARLGAERVLGYHENHGRKKE